MNKENKGKIGIITDNTYLEQLEEMDYPVIKRTMLTQEEFNEELRAYYCEAVPAETQNNIYLEDIETMGYPVVKVTQMSQEEFNELLRSVYVVDDITQYQTLITRKLLDNRELAKVS